MNSMIILDSPADVNRFQINIYRLIIEVATTYVTDLVDQVFEYSNSNIAPLFEYLL